MQKDRKIVVRARGIILCEGKLLVVKHPHNTSFSALPGGHLEWKEDIRECLRREIIEELGVNPEIGRLLYVNNFIDKDDMQSIEFFFEITNAHEYKNIENIKRTHAHEIAEICWVNPNDIVPLLPKTLGGDFKKGEILSDQIKYIYN